MATVTAHMSMSLDGYVADENDGVNEVFAWMTGENLKQFMEETTGEVGAVISGRRTSDLAGGDIVRQTLDLGLLDAVRISLVPVVLGKGVPFFPNLGNAPILLSQPKVSEGDGVTHLDYGIVR
jgi:dihydrofolate reductase